MMDQSQTPATTSAGAIPDLVKIKPMQTDQTIDVQTSILEPIVANESFIKFQFDNKGKQQLFDAQARRSDLIFGTDVSIVAYLNLTL